MLAKNSRETVEGGGAVCYIVGFGCCGRLCLDQTLKRWVRQTHQSKEHQESLNQSQPLLVASLLLVEMPFAASSFLLLVRPGATSSVLNPKPQPLVKPPRPAWSSWEEVFALIRTWRGHVLRGQDGQNCQKPFGPSVHVTVFLKNVSGLVNRRDAAWWAW